MLEHEKNCKHNPTNTNNNNRKCPFCYYLHPQAHGYGELEEWCLQAHDNDFMEGVNEGDRTCKEWEPKEVEDE